MIAMNGETKRFMYLEAGSYALLNLQRKRKCKEVKTTHTSRNWKFTEIIDLHLGNANYYNAKYVFEKTRGPFLERPGNF